MNIYYKPLKVSDTDGKRIIAKIIQLGENVTIKLPFIQAVKKDKPEYAKNGNINITVKRENYTLMVVLLEKYLEDLFLKDLKNENRNSSVRNDNVTTRIKKLYTTGDIKKPARKRDTASVYSGTGGDKQSKNIAGRDNSLNMDKKYNKKID